MKKVLRHEEVIEENVVSLGKACIEAIDENDKTVTRGKGVMNVLANTPTIKDIPVEIFMEHCADSVYIYAGDSDGNLYEHLNGYAGLWVKRSR